MITLRMHDSCEIACALKHTFTQCAVFLQGTLLVTNFTNLCKLEVAGVIFSDSDSAPVPKFLNPGPAIFQI